MGPHVVLYGRYPFSRSPWSTISTLLTLDALQGAEVVAMRSSQRMVRPLQFVSNVRVYRSAGRYM